MASHKQNAQLDGALFRERFLRRLGPAARTLIELIDVLPQIGFYVTDTRGRLVFLNRKNYELCNIPSDVEVAGRSYRDFFPKVLSESYNAFDASVRQNGTAHLNNIVFCQSNGTALPIVLNNFALRDMRGRIIGTMAAYYQADEDWSVEWVSPIKVAVDYVHEHYAENITIAHLAHLCRTNVDRLRKLFEETLGVSPLQFLINFRVNKAKQLLEESELKLSDIAAQTGFFDQSHLTKTFKQARGITPSAYRKAHRRNGK